MIIIQAVDFAGRLEYHNEWSVFVSALDRSRHNVALQQLLYPMLLSCQSRECQSSTSVQQVCHILSLVSGLQSPLTLSYKDRWACYTLDKHKQSSCRSKLEAGKNVRHVKLFLSSHWNFQAKQFKNRKNRRSTATWTAKKKTITNHYPNKLSESHLECFLRSLWRVCWLRVIEVSFFNKIIFLRSEHNSIEHHTEF